jgi:hypothetical protein
MRLNIFTNGREVIANLAIGLGTIYWAKTSRYILLEFEQVEITLRLAVIKRYFKIIYKSQGFPFAGLGIIQGFFTIDCLDLSRFSGRVHTNNLLSIRAVPINSYFLKTLLRAYPPQDRAAGCLPCIMCGYNLGTNILIYFGK